MKGFRLWVSGRPEALREEVRFLRGLLEDPGLRGHALALAAEQGAGFRNIEYLEPDELELDAGAIELLTSGTTGSPKRHAIDWARALASGRGRSPRDAKWLLTYSPARWAGLSLMAHIIRNECHLVVPRSFEFHDIKDKLDIADHIAMTPTLFRKVLTAGGPSKSEHVRQVTFGGEYATQKVLDDAKRTWPNARISHVYAMTEIGDIASASDGVEGFLRMPGHLAPDGELIIGGKATGDVWRPLASGRHVFVSRKSTLIKVGAYRVSPDEVEGAMHTVEGVDQCRVYAKESALLGQIVCADYSGSIAERELRLRLSRILPKHCVPVLRRVPEIGVADSGKLSRK